MRCMPMKCIPMTCTPMTCTPMRCTPMTCNAREVQRHTPMRDTPVRHTPIRYTPVRYTPMRHPPIRCTLVGCMPVRYVLIFENGFVVLDAESGLAVMSGSAVACNRPSLLIYAFISGYSLLLGIFRNQNQALREFELRISFLHALHKPF